MSGSEESSSGGTPGPDPERLKLPHKWEDAVRKALGKKRPKDGWPKVDENEKKEASEDRPPKGQ